MRSRIARLLAIVAIGTHLMLPGLAAAEVPATKTSADFQDLQGIDAALKTKIDALLSKGVFEGVSDDSFGIDENATRAQFAKVLTLIYGVKVDDSVTTSSFADVRADDAANGWAIKYIEAAKKAGLIDGKSDTTFDPGANTTLGEFATAIVKGLGVKPDMTGTPWYADAVKQAIDKKVLPEDTDGAKLATRSDLVIGSYGGQQVYEKIASSSSPSPSPSASPNVTPSPSPTATPKPTVAPTPTPTASPSTPPPSYDPTPTPTPTAAAPSANPPGGTVAVGTQVSLATSTVGATIHYTIDGSTPTVSSAVYYNYTPLVLTQTTTVKAIATKLGMIDSPVMSETYTIADTTAPSFAATYPMAGTTQTANSKTVQVLVQADEAGTAYYVVVADNAPAPSELQVMAGHGSDDLPALASGNDTIVANVEKSFVTAALPAHNTAYDVYVVVKDTAGNASSPAKVDVATPIQALTVTGLVYANNALKVTFNMPVDETTAETAANYSLSLMLNMMAPPHTPTTATLLSSGTEVELDVGGWYETLMSGETIVLSVTGVEDTDHNVIQLGYNNVQYPLPVG
ncbi:S-layer homology domain-containing protein [Paenibacillus cymbidii]|uniref:S-layer homology domain-containing protein n=1 Tax=Paenibacillus cymbidii TaxID=1639034 RepID=UPI001081B56E|nr:S-layer homology domain-containing protein [Paenibacillus cymbidii]